MVILLQGGPETGGWAMHTYNLRYTKYTQRCPGRETGCGIGREARGGDRFGPRVQSEAGCRMHGEHDTRAATSRHRTKNRHIGNGADGERRLDPQLHGIPHWGQSVATQKNAVAKSRRTMLRQCREKIERCHWQTIPTVWMPAAFPSVSSRRRWCPGQRTG